MEIGNKVKTLIEKTFSDGINDFVEIPKYTEGFICEIYNDFVLVQIYDNKKINGVFDYKLNEIDIIK